MVKWTWIKQQCTSNNLERWIAGKIIHGTNVGSNPNEEEKELVGVKFWKLWRLATMKKKRKKVWSPYSQVAFMSSVLYMRKWLVVKFTSIFWRSWNFPNSDTQIVNPLIVSVLLVKCTDVELMHLFQWTFSVRAEGLLMIQCDVFMDPNLRIKLAIGLLQIPISFIWL